MKSEKINGIDKWDVRCAMETLQRAETIKNDKKMMAAVGVLAKEELTAMASVVAHTEKHK